MLNLTGTKPRVIVITRGGTATGEDRTTQRKIAEESGIRKAEEKTQAFDAKKERQSLRKQDKSSRGTKDPHLEHNQK
jgi:hypothetical protein